MSTKDKVILALIFIISVFGACRLNAQNGFRINKTEFFTVSVSADPNASIKEKGLNIVGEIEYAGIIYAKAGFESFSSLQGGYKDGHGAVGINFTSGYFEKTRYYAGLRSAIVFRDGGMAWNYGLESGVDFNLTDNLFIGLRATADKRNDQYVIFNWKSETVVSGFIRIGYKWNFKR